MKLINCVLPVTLFLYACSTNNHLKNDNPKVEFKTTDTVLQRLYDTAERKALWDIANFGKYQVLVEGTQYKNVWLETQPMGGYMYAKRNLDIAKNNIQIFMDFQREDGRLPGMISCMDSVIIPHYGWFQGFFFPMPAYELYYLLGKDKNYLQKVYTCLEQFDNYLWNTRDSDNNGCLETRCNWDTGEDNCVRFNGFPKAWPFDYPPSEEEINKMSHSELNINCKEKYYNSSQPLTVPIESMDIMSYSYSCRDVLSLISKELNNGKENYLGEQANKIKSQIKNYLWDTNQNACFDKDKDNNVMPILLLNNLRSMYFGSFDQDMADRFIKYHLLNTEEFWSPMPLTSIAANSPYFRNIPGNNWSGQPQGLSFQRSIRAMENYGHYAELTMIGKKFLEVVADSLKFTQQFYPFKKTINNSKDGYGPSILTTLELISRFYGVHIFRDEIYWSALNNNYDYNYLQEWNKSKYKITTKKDGSTTCSINNKTIASFTAGIRLATDIRGKLTEVIAFGEENKNVIIEYKGRVYQLFVEPNKTYRLNKEGSFIQYKSTEFLYKTNPDK